MEREKEREKKKGKRKKNRKQKSRFPLKILALTKTPKEENLGIRIHLKGYPVPADSEILDRESPQASCFLSSVNTSGYTRSLYCPQYTREQLNTQHIKFFCLSQILHLLDVKGFLQSLDAVDGQATISYSGLLL